MSNLPYQRNLGLKFLYIILKPQNFTRKLPIDLHIMGHSLSTSTKFFKKIQHFYAMIRTRANRKLRAKKIFWFFSWSYGIWSGLKSYRAVFLKKKNVAVGFWDQKDLKWAHGEASQVLWNIYAWNFPDFMHEVTQNKVL